MKRLMTVSNGPEAELIVARLREAGIDAVARGGALAAYLMDLGTHEVYVEDHDLERARALIGADEGVSEAELLQAEEESAAAHGLTGPEAHGGVQGTIGDNATEEKARDGDNGHRP
jgi:hypothetical protein